MCAAFENMCKIKETRSWRTCDTRAQNGTLKNFLGMRLSQCFFYLFCPTSVSIVLKICVYMHMSDRVQTVYELPLLPNNITLQRNILSKSEECEVLTGCLSLGRRPGGDWANTWHWTARFTVFFCNSKLWQPSYCHILFLIAFLEEVFIRNIWSSKFLWARERISSKFIDSLGTRPHKGSPALKGSRD